MYVRIDTSIYIYIYIYICAPLHWVLGSSVGVLTNSVSLDDPLQTVAR